MANYYTIPSTPDLQTQSAHVPAYMFPNTLPYVAVAEEFLSPDWCDLILRDYDPKETYEMHGCSGRTQEFLHPLPPAMKPVVELMLGANRKFWNYTLGSEYAAWLQSYVTGSSYQLHMDNAPGQNRKLTAVVLLSDREDYSGGVLEICIPDKVFEIPRIRGTVVIFPSWVLHRVTEVRVGFRQSLNLGMWGPV